MTILTNESGLSRRPGLRFEQIDVNRIIVGERLREVDDEHVTRLMDSFEQLGFQVQPIVCTSEMVLIDGAHRLRAAMELGWEQVDVGIASHIESEEDRAFLEGEANAARREMTLSQRRQLWVKVMKPRLSEVAVRNQKATRFADGGGNFPPPSQSGAAGRVRDLAQSFVGISEATMGKLGQLQTWTADDSLSAPIRKAAADGVVRADKLGKVDGEFKRVLAMVESFNAPPTLLAQRDSETLVSRMVTTVTRASQELRRLEMDAVVRALQGDPMAVSDWPGVISAAAWISEFVEEAGIRAGLRSDGR